MNEFDKDNLDFFLKGPQQEFEDWCEQASTNEINYAINLVRQAKRELELEQVALFDNLPDTVMAKDFLKKYTLKG
jgi:hypothetical protein